MHPDSAEAGTIRTYLDWIVELPWSRSTRDKLDIKAAKKVLDEDHFDLEKIKEQNTKKLKKSTNSLCKKPRLSKLLKQHLKSSSNNDLQSHKKFLLNGSDVMNA